MRAELAASLELPVGAIGGISPIGWCEQTQSWTFPEVNGKGEIIGILRRTRDGKKRLMKGGKRGLSIPSGWRERGGPVLLVEGPTDVLAGTLCGLAVIGRPSNTGGVAHLATLLADLDESHPVVVIGENDAKPGGLWPGRDGAEKTAEALAEALRRPVLVAMTPHGVKDLRNWAVEQADGAGEAVDWSAIGSAFLSALATEGFDPPTSKNYPRPADGEEWNNPHRLARLFVDGHRHGRDSTLIEWRDEFYEWRGGAWLPVTDRDLDARLARHCRAVHEADYPQRLSVAAGRAKAEGRTAGNANRPVIFPVTSKAIADARKNLSGIVNHPDRGIDAPFWLPGSAGRPDPAEVIAAPNGLFTLSDIAAGAGPFSPPTPRFFTPNALPFPVPEAAPAPAVWLRCLDQWFNGDAASIKGLQEWVGYLLTADTTAHKILMLVGPPRSGKGTILHTLTELAGPTNVASTTFAALGESFGLEPLLGKRVALIPDGRLSGRADVGSVVERLLSISGEDPQSVNRKNRRRVTSLLRVRFVLASNEIPRLPDASGALASRFHILRTPNSWLGKEDRTLKARLAGELPAILRWAAEGWVRLGASGMVFTPNAAAAEYQQELEDLSSPIRAFVRECCRVGPEHGVEIPALYAAWLEWNGQRHREVGSEQMFGRDLRSALPHIQTRQPRAGEGRRRVYQGVGLRPRCEWGGE